MSKHVNERFTEFQLGIEPDNTISTLWNFKKSANNQWNHFSLQDFCKTGSVIKDNFHLVPSSRIKGTIHNTLTVKIYSNDELAHGYVFYGL